MHEKMSDSKKNKPPIATEQQQFPNKKIKLTEQYPQKNFNSTRRKIVHHNNSLIFIKNLTIENFNKMNQKLNDWESDVRNKTPSGASKKHLFVCKSILNEIIQTVFYYFFIIMN